MSFVVVHLHIRRQGVSRTDCDGTTDGKCIFFWRSGALQWNKFSIGDGGGGGGREHKFGFCFCRICLRSARVFVLRTICIGEEH